MVAKPQLQSVGPNITPALMLEGLKSGKIGYGTGIDPKFPKRTPVFLVNSCHDLLVPRDLLPQKEQQMPELIKTF